MTVIAAKVIFILSTVLFAYHHFVFPFALQRLARRNGRKGLPDGGVKAHAGAPSVTVIVPAYQEEAMIEEKIRNLAAINYPKDRLRIVVALDGCTDATSALAKATLQQLGNPQHIELQDNPLNQGKLRILNTEIARAKSDIVALTDVSASFDADALRRVVEHFRDAEVGVVCPTYRLRSPGSKGEAKYWRFQTRLKACEAAVAAPMGAHGAFYAFRRVCWKPLPADTINDDFVLPMQIVADGYRAVYDESIVAWELEETSGEQEFGRRVRIGTGNMQQLFRFAGLLNPWRRVAHGTWRERAALAFVFASGKALRVLIPFIVMAGAAACLYLASLGYMMFASIAVSGLLVSVLGLWAILNRGPHVPKLVAWLGYLMEGHAASFLGAIDYLRGRRTIRWSSGQRHVEYVPFATKFGKRAFDMVFSFLALVLLWPLFIPIAIAVKLESAGPVFYRQRRVGRIWGDRAVVFELIKFRTMYQDAEAKSGAQWATKNDSRITRVGYVLRKTRLDELPQFLNVIAGDMSLIGPRPERPQLVGSLEEKLPFYLERTYGLRPGITGLAQVNQGYDTSIDDVRRKLLFDHAYAAHLSRPLNWLRMDLKIIFSTLWVMITGRGQ